MKSIPKLIRRFLAILMLSIILLFFLNTAILIALNLQRTPGASPWTTAEETGAGQLEDNPRLTEGERRKVAVILRQSTRMRNLTNDLNLTSKLEYEMQPIHKAQENAVAIAKQAAVDFINMDVDAPPLSSGRPSRSSPSARSVRIKI